MCTVSDCDGKVVARGFCTGHYQRLMKHGDPLAGTPLRRIDTGTYVSVHRRLHRERGPARHHVCVEPGCLRPATAWSWDRTGPSRVGLDHGNTVEWGIDLATYQPRCGQHHSWLDHGGTLTHCPRGHDRATVGLYPDGHCRECNKSDVKRAREQRARGDW